MPTIFKPKSALGWWARRKGAFAHPTPAESRNAFEKRLFRRGNRVGGSDMHPHAVEPEAEQALLLVGAIEHLGQRKFAFGRISEQGRRHDRGARIDERPDLMLPALAQPPVRQPGVGSRAALTH